MTNYSTILLLIVLFLIALVIGVIFFNKPNVLFEEIPKYNVNVEQIDLLKVNDEPYENLKPFEIEKEGTNIYHVSFGARADYVGNKNRLPIVVIPLIIFRGSIAPSTNWKTFILNENNINFTFPSLDFIANSNTNLITEDEEFIGDMTLGDTLFMTSEKDGEYIVKLTTIEKDIKSDFTEIFQKWCENPRFNVKCIDSESTFTLKNSDDCEDSGKYTDCQKSLFICGGEIYIKMGQTEENTVDHNPHCFEPPCPIIAETICNQIIDLTVKVSGGKSFDSAKKKINGVDNIIEDVELFFFLKNDECYRKYYNDDENSYAKFFHGCKDYILSSHTLKGYVVER